MLNPLEEGATTSFTNKFQTIFPECFKAMTLEDIHMLETRGRKVVDTCEVLLPDSSLGVTGYPVPMGGDLGVPVHGHSTTMDCSSMVSDSQMVRDEMVTLLDVHSRSESVATGGKLTDGVEGLFSNPITIFSNEKLVADQHFPALPNVTIRKKDGGRRKKEMAWDSLGGSRETIFSEEGTPSQPLTCGDSQLVLSSVFRPLRVERVSLEVTP